MKRVEIIIRPQVAELVCRDLMAWGKVEDLHAAEVLGGGRRNEPQQAAQRAFDLLPKVRIQGVIADEDLADLLDRVATHARTGRRGDGKIFVVPVADQA